MAELPQQSKKSEAQSRLPPGWHVVSDPWGERLGWLIGLFVITYCLLFVLAYFEEYKKADGSVRVNDKANILSPKAVAEIEQVKFPEDIPALVRTVSSIPGAKIGTFATELMSKDPNWQKLRHRYWLRRIIRQDKPWATGVYVLVSIDPRLLQIRFGHEIRLRAYQQLIAAGKWYRDQQCFEQSALDQCVINTMQGTRQENGQA